MRNMHCPEKPDLMVPAMQPIIKEILRQEQDEPIGEDTGDGYPVMPVEDSQDQQIDATEQQIDDAVQQHQIEVGKRIFPGIPFLFSCAVVGEQDFQPDYNDIKRCADEDEVLLS